MNQEIVFKNPDQYKLDLKKMLDQRYKKSMVMYERAIKTIPLGTQTFSKSRTQYPLGVSPMFLERGKAGHVWDYDGNEYVDCVCSQASVTLGYCDPDIDLAVSEQMKSGTILSLPGSLEAEVSELIVDLVPAAEMVRFGKNGSDVTSAGVRVARGFTKRDRIAVCGYHGWQDWYIGSTARNLGVPKAVSDLTHPFLYNDIESLNTLFKKYPGEIALVIMEPMQRNPPKDEFLHKVKELAHKNGALLMFDEVITGFRLSDGGAQELFGVTPDLTSLGKGMANGYPISAIVGRADVMKIMEEVFFSFTFGGELLSLAAAKAAMKKIKREPVTKTMKERGQQLLDGVQALIEKHDIGHTLSIGGHPAWTFLGFKDSPDYNQFEIKTLFLQEIFRRGVISIGSHTLNYSHTPEDVKKILSVYDQTFPTLQEAITKKRLGDFLIAEPLQNLFRVR